MKLSRRNLLKCCMLAYASMGGSFSQAQNLRRVLDDSSNFHFIFDNPDYREEFYQFLTNVFHLYPEDLLDELIHVTSFEFANDDKIYQQLQLSLGEITPFLSNFTYALPALGVQKAVMSSQTQSLLEDKRFEGYLEVGSTGRYLDVLEESLDIKGDAFFMSEREATYSIEDMIDRGQIFKAGDWIELNDYKTALSQVVPANSIDLVTVYIGFHHCSPNLREEFIGEIRDTMKVGASLILRDHDAKNEKMHHMVALAHDVFNMGTKESWSYNSNEARHFYSLEELDSMMKQFGFDSDGRRLFQEGDPTLNSLMLYTKR